MEQQLTTAAFTPLSKPAYYRDLLWHIHATKSGGRILLTTMTLDPSEPLVLELLEGLAEAAQRGVRVVFAYDAYNYLIHPLTKRPGPLYVWGRLPLHPTGYYATIDTLAEHLQKSGAHVHITNLPDRPRRNPFSGRSHIKTAIVDNTVYIGGCNLSRHSDIDLMTRLEHAGTADWLFKTMKSAVGSKSIRESLNDKDRKRIIDDSTELLLDAGVPGQSVIYDEALDFIDAANEWLVITCQFFPNSKTATRLLAAHRRGVHVKILYNHPYKHSGLQHKVLQSFVHERERLRMPKSFFEHQLHRDNEFIHAKVIASDAGAMVGSHNYVVAGVKFGTAELAFKRKESSFGVHVAAAIESQLIA